MNPDSQRIAIAEACGWTECHPATKTPHGFFEAYGRKKLPCGSRKDERLPDYLNDLNAMHQAEKVLGLMQRHHFANRVASSADAGWGFKALHATAAMRAEAFLRTIGKWEDSK